jgi:Protein of unknown function (DUF3261)
MSRAAFIAVLLAMLSACATRFPVAQDLILTLPRAEVLGADRYATQLVTVHTQDRSSTFQANLEIVGGELVVVASDAIGTPLFAIRHSRRSEIEMFAPIEGAPPLQLVLADLMLVYAPLEELSARLRGGSVEQDGRIRRVMNSAGTEVVTITYEFADPWSGRVRLDHVERAYSLEIITIESGPL